MTVEKIKKVYQDLPEKKKYIELISAAVSLPVMVTVLMLNLNNLRQTKSTSNSTPTPSLSQITPTPSLTPVISTTPRLSPTLTPTPTITPTPAVCNPDVSSVDFVTPTDNQLISSNSLTIDLTDPATGFCNYLWSYTIDGANWSEYTDKAVSIYNLSPGTKKIQVKVKSIVGTSTKLLSRTVTIQSSSSPTLTPSPTSIPTTIPTATPAIQTPTPTVN